MIRLRSYISILMILSFAKVGLCQEDFRIVWEEGCPEIPVAELTEDNGRWNPDSLEMKLFRRGYPFAVVEKETKDSVQYRIYCGPEVRYVRVQWASDSTWYIPPDSSVFKLFAWSKVLDLRQQLMEKMAGRGYPYSRLWTTPEEMIRDTLVLGYSLDTVRSVYIHEIKTSGNFKIHPNLFQSMIGLRENQRFSTEKIHRSEEIIRQWDFASLNRLQLDFDPFGVNLEYFIQEKSPSKFDILVALIPSTRPHQRYEITGNAYIDLQNQLRMAERLYLKFDKYANSSQSIDLRVDFPYLPVLNMGVLGEGLLDRRDSSVMDVRGRIGIQYAGDRNDRYRFYLERAQSRLITIDVFELRQTGLLPDELDYNYTALGIGYDRIRLDHPVNPKKGYGFQTNFTGGIRKIIRNGQILGIQPQGEGSISFAEQYSQLKNQSFRFGFSALWENFIPLGQFSTLRFRGMGEWLWSRGQLLENERLRLGGFQDFRGFSEKVFQADGFGEGTVEYRFLFGPESNAFLFSDFGAFYRSDVRSWNTPYSAGVGLNLGTRAGIFGISYAIGGHRNLPFSLKQSRVNFGLMVNY